MKPHQMAMAASVGIPTEAGAVATVPIETHAGFSEDIRTQPVRSEPTLVPDLPVARPHTLILTGELDRSSAHALEAEIERLCEEGVTGITLDLRGLTYIDSIGVAVIAFRCRLCQRRGYEFALIPGSALIQRAFDQARVSELLPFQEDAVPAPRLPGLVLAHRSRDGCEQ
jgi:anti-sigma B factor antagonist